MREDMEEENAVEVFAYDVGEVNMCFL